MDTDNHMEHMNTLSGQNAEPLGALATVRCHSIRPSTRMKQLKIVGFSINLILEIITINCQATYTYVT